mmetsp:Transcript_14839/g.52034  ORF Transcript_14839/g.52034 Transcript_14839/m.52034 type:complete len:408 (+) Transcript_14839:516-1739(+)
MFKHGIADLASQRDRRVWPIAGMMLITGLSVGITIPAFPVIVTQLGLTQAQFGYTVSAFGLSKVLANLPAGLVVESQGRRVAIIGGLAVAGLGTGGVGAAHSLLGLVGARFLTGIGASFMMAGATTAASDLSTPLNRTRMLAPVLTAFSAGTVLGPAIGGFLIAALGMGPTFALVTGLFLVNAVGTRFLIPETRPRRSDPPVAQSSSAAVAGMLAQWRPLLADPEVRAVLIVNVMYWVALAGGQMTLLPLLLTNTYGLGPAEIGAVFAGQAAINVAAAGPAAALADRFGPQKVLAPALLTMATALATLPLATGITEAAVPLALMALSSAALSSAPTAMVSNLATPASRAQALAVTRTMGDVGWLIGGAGVGALATVVGTGPALQWTGSLLVATAGWFAARRALLRSG